MNTMHGLQGSLWSLFESLRPERFFALNRPNGAAGERADRQTAAGPTPPSLILIDSVVRGSLVSSGDVFVEGTIEGDVQAAVVVVGSSGLVEGLLSGRTVTIYGRVIGIVRADEVCLMPGSHVEGDVISGDLSLHWGALLEGRCLGLPRSLTFAAPIESESLAQANLPELIGGINA